MLTKTFHAETMLAAFQAIQQELGTEAIVVSVRKTSGGAPWQVWKKPGVEVVAMGSQSQKTPGAPAQLPRPELELVQRASQTPELPAAVTHPQPVGGWVDQAEQTGPVRVRKPAAALAPPASENFPPLAKARLGLTHQGVDEKLIGRVVKTCAETLNPLSLKDDARVRSHLSRLMEAELRIQTPSSTLSNRIMCLVGASGSGKTSTCAKLAAFFTRTLEKRVVWICADTVRTGAIAEARMYTETLDIPLYLAYTPEDLAQAVETEEKADLILVDMPGVNPRSETRVVELGGFLTAVNKRSTYIVAPATTKEPDLMDLLAAFGPFNLKGLIFTKMDETRVFGSLYNIASRSQLPLAFFTNGTHIMDDLYPGQESDLVSALFHEGFAQ